MKFILDLTPFMVRLDEIEEKFDKMNQYCPNVSLTDRRNTHNDNRLREKTMGHDLK
jgi:hypothetical protein